MIELGRGRSAVVYKNEEGNAVKYFVGSKLASVANSIVYGNPLDYRSNVDAVKTARHRRNVLDDLCNFWTHGKLRVSRALSDGYDEEKKAHYIETEFIDGRYPRFNTPLGLEDEVEDLTHKRTRLIDHLRESGFYGLDWQAGAWNPTGQNNFLFTPGENGDKRWTWIDLESGVPPYATGSLRTIYTTLKTGELNFDNMDHTKLRSFISNNEKDLRKFLGSGGYENFKNEVNLLTTHYINWKAHTRVEKGIHDMLLQGNISEKTAEFYNNHPSLWIIKAPSVYISKGLNYVTKPAQFLAKAIFSRKFKQELGEKWINNMVKFWSNRLNEEDTKSLEDEIEKYSTAEYIGDQATMLAIKPFEQVLSFVGIPALALAGYISPLQMTIGLAISGSVERLAYTGLRCAQNLIQGKHVPLKALATSTMPIIGNFAFSVETYMANREDKLPKLIFTDIGSLIARKIPLYGGSNTQTEHAVVNAVNYVVTKDLPFNAIDLVPGVGAITFASRSKNSKKESRRKVAEKKDWRSISAMAAHHVTSCTGLYFLGKAIQERLPDILYLGSQYGHMIEKSISNLF
jgi:hypothetical protein